MCPDDGLSSLGVLDAPAALPEGAVRRPSPPPRLILASGSVGRRRLMARHDIRFMVEGSGVDEAPIKADAAASGLGVEDTALMIARAKAAAVSARFPRAVVVAADTIGVIDKVFLDKPMTLGKAITDLRLLAGRTHLAVTAVSVWRDRREVAHLCRQAEIEMRSLTDAEIDRYLTKAGPQALLAIGAYEYGQPVAEGLVKVVSGDPHVAVGLPLADVMALPDVAATQVSA